MSYFDYPRLHFSGKFIADPSTINNYSGNYDVDGDVYKMQLYWNPLGTGGFNFEDCVINKIEYSDGTSATTSAEDPIIGQTITAVKNFFLSGAIVDLDPRQQMVSTLFGINMQIGDDDEYARGEFSSTPFNGIWNFPVSTASATYQGQLSDVFFTDQPSSKFFQEINSNSALSVNFAVNQYNISPQLYSFNDSTFSAMLAAGVPQSVLNKLTGLKKLSQYQGTNGDQFGDIPTETYVTSLLTQLLSTEEYNQYQSIIFSTTKKAYTPGTQFDFTKGLITGTIGPAGSSDTEFVVASRALAPASGVTGRSFVYFTNTESGGVSTAYLNFSNALEIEQDTSIVPYGLRYKDVDNLYLATASSSQYTPLHSDPLNLGGNCLIQNSGFISVTLNQDISSTPICLVQKTGASTYKPLLQENSNGYFMRADKFVYRMNPSSSDPDYGDTAGFNIHVYQYGKPVTDSLEIELALSYNNMGSPVKIPDGVTPALSFTSSKVSTVNGVASFTMKCTEPPKPSDHLDGQIYLIQYNFSDSTLKSGYKHASGDTLSVHVYQSQTNMNGREILRQYGEIYPIMSFLMTDAGVEARKGMILTVLQAPMNSISHMPVTRDMSIVKRTKALSWVESLAILNIDATVKWQNTGLQVNSGDTVSVVYESGQWTANPNDNGGQLYGPDGNPSYIDAKPGYALPGQNEGALVGRIGSDVFLVGTGVEHTTSSSGTLELCINDDLDGTYGAGFSDNKGSLKVSISLI